MAVKQITSAAEYASLFAVSDEGHQSLPVVLLVVEGRWKCSDNFKIYWLNRSASENPAKETVTWALIVGDEIKVDENDFRLRILTYTPKLYYYAPDGSEKAEDDFYVGVYNLLFQKIQGRN